MQDKRYYNRKHHPQFLREGDYALLRLHRGYNIPSNKLTGRKYGQQMAGPFKVTERVGQQAYRLAIPEDWKIHPVFTIAELEPCPPPEQDPYRRQRPTNPGAVETERDDLGEEWELDRLLDKRVIRKGKGLATEYLVRWKGWGTEWDRWLNTKNIFAESLIQEYEANRTTAPVPKGRQASSFQEMDVPRPRKRGKLANTQ